MFAHLLRSVPPAVCLSACLLVLGGCGDDADPGRPAGDPAPDTFDEALAVDTLADVSRQLRSLLDTLPGLVTGAPEGDLGLYDWNAAEACWEHTAGFGGTSFAYAWRYRLTFRDGAGAPVQAPAAAASAVHEVIGVGFTTAGTEPAVTRTDLADTISVVVTGLEAGPLLAAGGGLRALTVTATTDGVATVRRLAATWRVRGAGFTWPAEGGCPAGAVEGALPPYRAGASTAGDGVLAATLVDAAGDPVPAGTRTWALACPAP